MQTKFTTPSLVSQAKRLSDQPIGVLERTRGATICTGGADPAKRSSTQRCLGRQECHAVSHTTA
jgi:hypothetical protein